MLEPTPDKLTTFFSLTAGILEVLIEFDYIDKRAGGLALGISLVFWGFLTNNLAFKVEKKSKKL